MRYGIALLFLLVASTSSLSAQAVALGPARQSAWAPAPAFVEPFGSSPLQRDRVLPTRFAPSPRAQLLRRHVGWGTLLGASAGVVSSILVLSFCNEYCEGSQVGGVALHVGVGAVGGAALGAVLHQLRR